MKQMRSAVAVLVLVVVGFSFGCRRSGVVAEVGSRTISKSDVAFRNRVIRVYQSGESRDLGLDQLVKSYINAQILENNGRLITHDLLEKEAKRIQQTTLAPDSLRQIQEVFGTDHEAYLRDFVLPAYADRIIYFDFFLKDPKVQAAAFAKANSVLAEVRANPTKIREIAAAHSLMASKFSVSAENGFRWKEAESERPAAGVTDPVYKKIQDKLNDDSGAETKTWIETVAAKLKPGEVSPQFVDRGEYWLLVRFIGRRGPNFENFEFDGIQIPKEDYAAWMKGETAKVRVTLRQSN